MVDKIKNKTNIDVDKFIERLEKELSINTISKDEKKKEANEQLVYCVYDVLVIILDVTHQNIISEELYTTWLNMVKDYWYLNKYDDQFVKSIDAEENEDKEEVFIKEKPDMILVHGDTTTTFADTTSQIEINGTTYNTGTIDFDNDILIEKYKKALYRHRKMRW